MTLLLFVLIGLLAVALLPYFGLVLYLVVIAPVRLVAATFGAAWSDVEDMYQSWHAQGTESRIIASLNKRAAYIAQQNLNARRFGLKKRSTQDEALALVAKETTANCCRMLKILARLTGTENLAELQGHELWDGYRARAISSIALIGGSVKNDRIFENVHEGVKVLTLGKVYDNCLDCEMLRHSVASMPEICGSARAFGNDPLD